MIEQMRSDEQERRLANRQAPNSPSAASSRESDEGYWAYMQRQVQERTANLGITGDSIDKLEDNSSGWANDVNKFVGKQKKKAVMGGKCFFTIFHLVLLLVDFGQSSGASLDFS